ncbi:MAG: hypothetical protein H0U55_14545 [Rubrobacteraceae bacterium]|nr:hypothetical protein [Rubrobacteraceae bacterium]
MEQRLQVERRPRKDARDMVMALALYGNHYHESDWGNLSTTRRVEEFFAAGDYTLGEVIEECRDKDSRVPLLENLIPISGWKVGGGPGVVVSHTDSEGNEVARLEGESGFMVAATDAALFEKAVDDFERAIARMSYTEYLSALANGLASIEAYIAQKAYQHNVRNPGDELLDDKDHKVAFEDKIREWAPKMAGAKLDLGNKHWAHFQRLKRVRDTEHTHTKSPALHISYRELCKLLNLFRTGIAGLSLNLHALFGDTTPSVVVKYAFHPDIKLVTVEEQAS